MKSQAGTSIEIPTEDGYPFRGRPRNDQLQFFGMFQGCSSIANVCHEVAKALEGTPGGLAIHSTNGNALFQPALERLSGVNEHAPMALYWGIPETVPPGFFRHDFTIGSFVCETHQIPQRWARIANRFDLLLVPSQFCRTVFLNHGVERPVMVVPHGLEPEYRPREPGPGCSPFIFYNALGSSFFRRKGTDLLLRAFKKAFPGDKNVVLRLRVGDETAVQQVLEVADMTDSLPRIVVESTQDLSTEDFANIYSQVHCTVHPTRGEGFGLIPLQSLACGTPVISPIHTGLMDTLNAGWVAELGWKEPVIDPSSPEPALYELDEEQLVKTMRAMVQNYPKARQRALSVAPIVRERLSWTRSLEEFTGLMRKLATLNTGEERRALVAERIPNDLT